MDNMVVGSNNYRGVNIRGRGGRMMVDKRSMQWYNYQKLG